MKILYYAQSFPNPQSKTTGIFIYRRARELIEAGIDVKVLSPNSIFSKQKLFNFKKNYNLKEIGFELDLEVEYLNYIKIPGIQSYISLTNQIKNIFVKENFDLFHTHFVWDGYIGYLLKKRFGIPYILTCQGTDIHTIPFESEKNRIFALKILHNAEKVIFVSNYLLEKAKEFGYLNKNSIVINNGADLNIFKILENNSIKIKKENECIIGFIGDLINVKRANKLPEIFYEINKKLNNSKFVIIGEGEFKNEILLKLKNLGLETKVMFASSIHTNMVSSYLNNFDVLLLPSKKEGFPCVVIESLACGVPVIGSNNGGIPEAIGDCGKLIDDGDHFEERFASAVVELLKNPLPKEKLVERAREYSWENIVKKEIALYKELLHH